jgi:hypothetical protein
VNGLLVARSPGILSVSWFAIASIDWLHYIGFLSHRMVLFVERSALHIDGKMKIQ